MSRETINRTSQGGGGRASMHSASAGEADLRCALRELDGLFGEMKRALRLQDGSDRPRLELAATRRVAREGLDALLRQIGAAMVEWEYLEPGISDRVHEIWLEWIGFDPLPGETTLLGFMGRVRRVLLDITAHDPRTSTRTSIASAGKVNGHAGLSTVAVVPASGGGRPETAVGGTLPSSEGKAVLKEREAAKRLQVSVQTLRKWRAKGEGPRPAKVTGKAVRYSIEEIDNYIRSVQ